jgi:hypothetical protein
MRYEYIRILVDFGDLEQLNNLGSVGWHVVATAPHDSDRFQTWVLLERPLPAGAV